MPPDHYAVLGVPPDADGDTLRAAYLRLMRATHPDLRPGDAEAGERARRANEAWRVLSEPQRRAAYDRQLRARTAHLPDPARTMSTSAYSPHREQLRSRFERASLATGAGVFLLGLVLLALTAR